MEHMHYMIKMAVNELLNMLQIKKVSVLKYIPMNRDYNHIMQHMHIMMLIIMVIMVVMMIIMVVVVMEKMVMAMMMAMVIIMKRNIINNKFKLNK